MRFSDCSDILSSKKNMENGSLTRGTFYGNTAMVRFSYRLEIASPRPVPFSFVVKNGWKILANCSLEIPHPLS